MSQQQLPALDRTGTQAAIYPSEQQLWYQGPPITDPTDPIVYPDTGGPFPNLQALEDQIHEQMNGQTSNEVWEEEWVNVQQYGPTGFGPWTDEGIFQTGHSQNVVSNPSSEQGWGVGPARRWSHFPIEDSPNPTRNFGQATRNGQLPWVVADTALYYRTQLAYEQSWARWKHRSPVSPVVPVAEAVPFSATVPTYSGGPQPIAGVDVPTDDHMMFGGVY